jgi:ribosomal protein S12 methylthiotransferase accessory factor
MSADSMIAVCGSGMLAQAVAAALGPGHEVTIVDGVAAIGGLPSALVVVGDDVPTADVFSFARDRGVPWVGVRIDDEHIQVGPVVHPATPGCPTCVLLRSDRNRPGREGRQAYAEQFGPAAGFLLLTELSAAAAAALVRHLVDRPQGPPEVFRLSMDTATVTAHRLLPDPFCPDCGQLPADRAENALIPRRTVPKRGEDVFRVLDLVEQWPAVERTYVDSHVGVVRSLQSATDGICATVTAFLEPETTHSTGHGFGRELNFAGAKVAALAEALERLGGRQSRGSSPAVRAAYQDIADRAIDPVTLGTYPPDRYALPGFPYLPYSPDLELSWVWAYSFAQARPVLVPENVAYYGHGHNHEQIVYETSNGCALGGCLEEAVLHGLLEVAERDAFLLTWYSRLPAPRVDLSSAGDRRIPLLVDRALHEFGYDVQVFDISTEQNIPAYWLMGIDRTPADDRPTVMCGAAAHMLPEQALRNGLHEFITLAGSTMYRYDRDDAAALVADGNAVRAMEDHSLLYGHPDAFGRLGFLPADGPARPIAERAWPRYGDLTDDLMELVGRYLSTGLDVLVVNQTSAEHEAAGLACAKVIVPGAVPMTFGHVHRRDHGLPRILRAPRLAGHLDRDLRPDEVNPDPHPFP